MDRSLLASLVFLAAALAAGLAAAGWLGFLLARRGGGRLADRTRPGPELITAAAESQQTGRVDQLAELVAVVTASGLGELSEPRLLALAGDVRVLTHLCANEIRARGLQPSGPSDGGEVPQ